MRRAASVVLAVATAALVAGCGPGQGMVARIETADSPLIEQVRYLTDFTGTGDVRVFLIPGATRVQAHELWCEVIIPAVGDDLGKLPLNVWSSDPAPQGASQIFASDSESCP